MPVRPKGRFDSESLEKLAATQRFASNACLETGIDELYKPTHTVELRLDPEGTPYVHSYSILHAVSNALLRPGHEIVRLDRAEFRKLITNNLFLSVGDIPHRTHFPDVKPAIRIVVTFEDGVQREVLGYDFGTSIQRNDAPHMLAMCGVLRSTTEQERDAFESIFQWDKYPGLRIANWVMPAAHALSNNLRSNPGDYPPITRAATPLIHSFKAFELPENHRLFKGEVNFRPNPPSARPIKSAPTGVVLTSKVNLLQNGECAGGGFVKLAFSPHCM